MTTPPLTTWAAYISYRGYAELFLAVSEIDALKTIGAMVEGAADLDETNTMDVDTLRDTLGEVDGLHWRVEEVQIP